ncbi:hypothetical protein, variant [Cryptococcus amylolentus CBS 6039]|uniref:CBS domain-containing protein n=2 Tax=Cryptococcus amylolentus TaxID=104669 RepID=A0A1E3HIJ8_9TREE|nr:hypothetical protein L202_06089 [Cryptococcus amylolentus CBS 6039]XP_018991701.1 hypothetical protein, variant [Cryptococcus amylolentus CBS 6039]ODN76169.1 hypothetical protein L202_06089 [Cryptococcus amylolentus CBS 6039]ODN76170.1 hypothetical protein, variant [Cryptococcus amylolentus CBS 6039]ODN96343.1 hypothetical protein I350_08370 [Cryptococcus amylolentus CBS 6273]
MAFDKDTTPRPAARDYRGACVEDLQLSPAFCLPQDAIVLNALETAYEREFDHLPILNHKRKPIGYLDIPSLKQKLSAGAVTEHDPVSKLTNYFTISNPSNPYTVISPLTPLEELELFFEKRAVDFALVTDGERKWVLGVATKDDLETFAKRRG